QVSLAPDVDLTDVETDVSAIAIAIAIAMAGCVGARRCLAHPVEQASLHEDPFVSTLDKLMCGAAGLLYHRATGEVAGKVVQFVVEHALGVTPALVRPEQVHADALDNDRQQQRAYQH